MSKYLHCRNFSCPSGRDEAKLSKQLEQIIANDLKDNIFSMLGTFQRILADNRQRDQWDSVFGKLKTLFLCGSNGIPDGPMIGVPVAIRDSDYFRQTAGMFGSDRSSIASLEWMATCWNLTFANTGLWMGKTFEPVSKETFAAKCDNDPGMMPNYSAVTTRIGRNFFREPPGHNLLQGMGIPVLTKVWQLRQRPLDLSARGFWGELLQENIDREKCIPYSMTGGLFLAQPGMSVVPEMAGKAVYQLNYRWPALEPAYPMTRLVDEIVQIADGVYLGQLVMATSHYSPGALYTFASGDQKESREIGEPYRPADGDLDYGYQNNGFFLMIDSAFAAEAYADNAFPYLRPRCGETGYVELGYDKLAGTSSQTGSRMQTSDNVQTDCRDRVSGWRNDDAIRRKFTTFCLETSTKHDDGDVREYLRDDESILQMIQRIQSEIACQSSLDDILIHFDKLNRLFRSGVAPRIVNGVFQGQGKGFNTRFDTPEKFDWYGSEEVCSGFDYYHGATINLHLGFGDSLRQTIDKEMDINSIMPSGLATLLQRDQRGPNILDAVWASIGRFIFPWAGKSYERISGRKLSMLLDESSDLAERYPERVEQLKNHPASWPHYDLVKKNRDRFWSAEGPYTGYLKSGSWDNGMCERDRLFWEKEASDHWIFGNNIQDSRILATDAIMRLLDMNYHPPAPSIQKLADSGPSPFVRQGYIFLGVSDRESILPMNNNGENRKRVFQFHYRYPMIGGPAPIGTCLDELVEIAEGLFLGQLIYSTVPWKSFHTSVDPAEYEYQLFGYFLLMDNEWEAHRQAICFDVDTVLAN